MAAYDAHICTAMVAAWRAGVEAADNVKPGEIFRGAYPEAERSGFRARMLQSCFTCGYLEHLPENIVTDLNDVIVSAGKRRESCLC